MIKKLLLIVNFIFCITTFTMIPEVDIILNNEKFKKNKIMEIRKIDLSGIGERRRIYFYDNGEVEDINFEEYNDRVDMSINHFKLENKEDIEFLKNLSLEAINSIKNDKIKFFFEYSSNKLKFKEEGFPFLIGNFSFLKNQDNIYFNDKRRQVNYLQIIKLDSNLETSEIHLENAMYLYEIIYKDKMFLLSSLEEDYQNQEIKKFLQKIKFPFFTQKTTNYLTKISENDLIPNIQIQKIEFFDNSNYNYSTYTLGDGKIIKTVFNETGFLNQVHLKKEEYQLNDKIEEKIKKILLKKHTNNKLMYNYTINSLNNFKNDNYKGNKNEKMIVEYGEKKYQNPIVYKIYYNSLSPIIVIKGSNNKYMQELLNEIKKIENSKKIKNLAKESFGNNETKMNYEEKLDKVISKELQEIIKETKNNEFFEIDCQSFNKNRDLYYIKYNDFLIEFDNDKRNILMSELSKFLKRKWKYRGLTLEETEKINYERWKEYCKNKNNLSPLEKILYF